MSKYLIVTADDFGISQATNEAIEDLAIKGLITSTSLLLPGKAMRDAVERSKNLPDLGIGLHFTLTSDLDTEKWQSCASKKMVGPLVNEAGFLHDKMETLFEEANSAWVVTELAAQFCYGESLGLNFEHVNFHGETFYGLSGQSFLQIAIHFCAGHQMPFRFTREFIGMEHMLSGDVDQNIKKAHIEGAEFALLKKVPLPDLVLNNPFSLKDIPSYEYLKQSYVTQLRRLPEGVTELVMHPSKATDEEIGQNPEWQKRIWDYDFLLDEDFTNLLIEEGIQLVTWKQAFAKEAVCPK